MSINMEGLAAAEAASIMAVEEGQFSDVKSIAVSPAQLTKVISAFANSDGGEVYIGITESGFNKTRGWEGFKDQEAANGHLQIFEKLFPLGTDFQYEFLRSDQASGLVLHVQVNKTAAIMRASNDLPYVRRGAQSIPVDTPEAIKRLEYAKGLSSFEDETTNARLSC